MDLALRFPGFWSLLDSEWVLPLSSHSRYKHSFASQWSYFCSLDFDFALNGFLFDSNRVKCLEREMSLCDSFEIQGLPDWIDWSTECSSVDIK